MRLKRLVTAFVLIATLACRSGKKDEQYRVEKVDRGDVTMTVTATGTVSAVTTVQIGSQVSGVIAHLYADFNSRVKKDQLLAELDPTPFQAQVEQRRADVTKAQVEAANAKITLDRQARLLQAGLAAQADYDGAKAQYDSARAQVQQSSAALSQALTNLKYTKILSPIDGVVVDRQYDVGQTVAASFQAPTLFSIAQDLTKMQVQADVDQSDIGRVRVGQLSRFSVDAYPDEEFRGRIAQMRLNATVSQNVVTYPVIIEVPNPDEKLRPKMTANVTIDVAVVRGVLRIPNSALRFKPDTGQVPSAVPSATSATSATSTTSTAQRAGGGGSRGGAGGGGAPGGGGGERGMAGFGRGRGFGGAAGMMPSRQAPPKQQTIYLLEPDKKLKPVAIRTGISDGRNTQVVDGDVRQGDNVVIGLVTSKVDSAPPPGSNRGPMGGGGGGRRGPG